MRIPFPLHSNKTSLQHSCEVLVAGQPVVDFSSWDRLGIVNSEQFKRNCINNLTPERVTAYNARKYFLGHDFETLFENKMAAQFGFDSAIYFDSETQAYLTLGSALLPPGAPLLAPAYTLAPLDDLLALLDGKLMRLPINSEQEFIKLAKEQAALSSSSLWVEDINPITGKTLSSKCFIDSTSRNIIRDVGANIWALCSDKNNSQLSLERAVVRAKTSAVVAPLTYTLGLPGAILCCSQTDADKILSNSNFLSKDHARLPFIYAAFASALDYYSTAQEQLLLVEAKANMIRAGLHSLGCHVEALTNSLFCTFSVPSITAAEEIQKQLLNRGFLVCINEWRELLKDRGLVRILPSVFHVEHQLQGLLNALADIKNLGIAI